MTTALQVYALIGLWWFAFGVTTVLGAHREPPTLRRGLVELGHWTLIAVLWPAATVVALALYGKDDR